MRIAVCTAIFGNKDVLRESKIDSQKTNLDFFLITDDPEVKTKYYEIIHKKIIFQDITKNARYYKIIGLKIFDKYDYVIWHDANLEIVPEEIPELIKIGRNASLSTFRHPLRKNFYDEAIACLRYEKDIPSRLVIQCLKYFLLRVSTDIGFFETSLVIKNNNFSSKAFLHCWWREVKNMSRRDQIAFIYSLHRNPTKIGIIPGERRNNSFSIFHKHNYKTYKFHGRNEKKKIILSYKNASRIISFLWRLNRKIKTYSYLC